MSLGGSTNGLQTKAKWKGFLIYSQLIGEKVMALPNQNKPMKLRWISTFISRTRGCLKDNIIPVR